MLSDPIVTLKRALNFLIVAAGVWLLLFTARRTLHVTHGLHAEYFATDAASASPSFSSVDPDISITQVARRWGDPLPPTFKVRWFGYIQIRQRGSYTFTLTSDDGSTLWIDGRLLVDNGGRHSARALGAPIDLESGSHVVLIEYVQLGGSADLSWTWTHGGSRTEPVPAWVLTPGRQPAWKIEAARVLDLALLAVLALTAAWTAWIAVTFGSPPAVGWAREHPNVTALGFFVVLTIVETWPLSTDPVHLSRNDNADTVLNEWAIAWAAHAAPRHPLQVFDGNAFYPERNTLAFSETMVVQSAMAAPILWAGGTPVLAYNLVLLAGFVLTGWATYVVMAKWTGSQAAALTAGTLLAFNAHAFTRLPHLQAQHVEFLPFALFALDRLFQQPNARNALKLAMWFALQALTSIYLLVLTAAALTAAASVRPDAWRGKRLLHVAPFVLLSASGAGLLLLPYILPYWQLYQQGLSRTIEETARFSASWRNYLSTPSQFHYRLWSHTWFAGPALFPGVLAVVLTGFAVARGVAFADRRARMFLALGIAGVVLSFGTKLPGFVAIYEILPLLHSVRVVSRFGFLGIVATAGLAGFGVTEVRRLVPSRFQRAVGAALVLLAAAESFPGPLELTRFDGIPRIYRTMRSVPRAVVVEMPFYGAPAGFAQAQYMLNSTVHWKPILNGYTGLHVPSYQKNLEQLAHFPDHTSIAALQAQRVTHVFVHTDAMPPAAVSQLDAIPELQRIAAEGPIVLFRLAPGPTPQ